MSKLGETNVEGWPMKNIRSLMLDIASRTGRAHVPSALSILDILQVLYGTVMQPDDRFVLSKGHGCLALYLILFIRGHLSNSQILSMGEFDSILGGHPDSTKIPGVEFSTGSLGHGFPMAVGLALAKKLKKEPGRIFCLVGDGECNEGSIMEAAALAVRYSLDNLTLVIDRNHSDVDALDCGDIGDRLLRMGWWVFNTDGHDHKNLELSLNGFAHDMPLVVVAQTIKGYGVTEMERDPKAWHYRQVPRQMFADR